MITLYFLGLILELILLTLFCLYVFSLLYSVIRGSFYVSTNQKQIDIFLKEANLKKGQYFLELGSGDGKVLRTAAKQYGVIGKGIDINPVLNIVANFLAKRQKLHNITFTTENVFTTNLSRADILYIFLMPTLIDKIQHRLLKETKKNAVIISHGFKINALEKYLVHSINAKPFSTYFYRLKST